MRRELEKLIIIVIPTIYFGTIISEFNSKLLQNSTFIKAHTSKTGSFILQGKIKLNSICISFIT